MLLRNNDSAGINIQDILRSTRAAIIDKKKVRIATIIGNNITYQFMAKQIGNYVTKGGRNLVKVIIRVARSKSDLN